MRIKQSKVTACDVNPHAIENMKLNCEKLSCKMDIKQSNMFGELKNTKYDVIYWNYPFHPSKK